MSLLRQDFHARYYHPSNARFWFYGDDPAEERLRILSEYLDQFDARPVDSHVERQPLFPEPRRVVDRYAAGDDQGAADDAGKVRANLNLHVCASLRALGGCSCLIAVAMIAVIACYQWDSHVLQRSSDIVILPERLREPLLQAFVSVNWVLAEEPLDLATELGLEFLDFLLVRCRACLPPSCLSEEHELECRLSARQLRFPQLLCRSWSLDGKIVSALSSKDPSSQQAQSQDAQRCGCHAGRHISCAAA